MKIAPVVATRPKAVLMPAVAASRDYCNPVSVQLAVSRCAGIGIGRFAVVGVAMQIRAGSVSFDSLTAGFAGSAVVANALVGALGT